MQSLSPASDGTEELLEIHLERRQNLICPVLHLETRFTRLAVSLLDDLFRLSFRQLDDLRLRGLADGLLTSLSENPIAFALRLGEHLLSFLDDPACLLDLLGDRGAHLIEDVVDLFAIDAYLIGKRHGFGAVHKIVELVYEDENIHAVEF